MYLNFGDAFNYCNSLTNKKILHQDEIFEVIGSGKCMNPTGYFINGENVVVTDESLVVHGTKHPLEKIRAAYVAEESIKKTNWRKLFKIWIALVILGRP